MISVRTSQGEESILLDEFEARIREGTIGPGTMVRFPVLTGERWVDARELELFRRLYTPARINFTRAFSLGRFPWLTMTLCLLQVVIYFGIAGTQLVLPLDTLIESGAKVQPNIMELGESWRLITANFLHRDVLHLLFNMFFLFNVGGTIENAYRLQDYVLILVASAVATTVLSTLMSTSPSVGASGMVLGLFGSASVFGYKYSDILPRRYRRYFGGAVVPYALFILYLGLVTKNTDNWGHLGGLLGGLVATTFLDPKLLHFQRKYRFRLVRYLPAIASSLMFATVLAAGPVVRSMGPSYRELRDLRSGVRLVYPTRWRFGENHLGYPTWGNSGLGASIGVTAEVRTTHPFTLQEIRRRFRQEDLQSREREGDITSVRIVDERPFLVDGGRGLELRIELESRTGPMYTRNFLIERGYYRYAVVLSTRARWAAQYRPIFDAMAGQIRLIEPQALSKSREVVTVFPGMSSAHVELGHELANIGDAKGAALSYQRALEALPEHADALYGLAKLAADYDGDLVSAEKIATELYEAKPEEPAFSALLADLRKRLGQTEGACAVLQETLDRVPEPPEDLRERLRELRCRSSAGLDR